MGHCPADCAAGHPAPVYDGGGESTDVRSLRAAGTFPVDSYMWASVQTVRGCPKHCSFCSVWRTDGQQPRLRGSEAVVTEIRDLRRRGFPLRAAGGRQLLSGDLRRPGDGEHGEPTRPRCTRSRPCGGNDST